MAESFEIQNLSFSKEFAKTMLKKDFIKFVQGKIDMDVNEAWEEFKEKRKG